MQEAIHYCRVYAYDTDYGGIVHHASYLRFLEQARTEWLDQEGGSLQDLYQRDGLFFVLRDLQASYHVPARLHQGLAVVSQVERARRVALVFKQSIYDRDDLATVLFSAELFMVCVNRSLRPRPIPAEFMRKQL